MSSIVYMIVTFTMCLYGYIYMGKCSNWKILTNTYQKKIKSPY